ncbi:hypothetical protein ABW20_dc0100698 [Dactylellina cionopaga]|nr:hypothetical protein ABW20_dc0100698 [Dactylellina cionopaga]
MLEPSIGGYTIGWICALREGYDAASEMLDERFVGPDLKKMGDHSTYLFGRVSRHNVVIRCMPTGRYGANSATNVATNMIRSFPNIKFALMVGIGGGAPTRERDIRLGDVVVSTPEGRFGGVVQYDVGQRLSGGRFEDLGHLNGPPLALLSATMDLMIRWDSPRSPDRISEHLRRAKDMTKYQRPADDRLYRADYEHKGGNTCAGCSVDGLEERPPREARREVTLHYGTIASGNSIMKDALERDNYSNDPDLNVLCFEMEAYGLMNYLPCLAIRGIANYSDSHKNDEWRNYAALTAAAYTRELLCVLRPVRVVPLPPWSEELEKILTAVSSQLKVDSMAKFSTTPLLRTTKDGYEVVFKLLLEKGTEMGPIDNHGTTSLSHTAYDEHKNVSQLVLKGIGANPDPGEKGATISENDLPQGKNTSLCHICTHDIRKKGPIYNCDVCHDGDFDICFQCFVIGAKCLNWSHENLLAK